MPNLCLLTVARSTSCMTISRTPHHHLPTKALSSPITGMGPGFFSSQSSELWESPLLLPALLLPPAGGRALHQFRVLHKYRAYQAGQMARKIWVLRTALSTHTHLTMVRGRNRSQRMLELRRQNETLCSSISSLVKARHKPAKAS
jgi:hypothetical protein